jgi:hypothetical protein
MVIVQIERVRTWLGFGPGSQSIDQSINQSLRPLQPLQPLGDLLIQLQMINNSLSPLQVRGRAGSVVEKRDTQQSGIPSIPFSHVSSPILQRFPHLCRAVLETAENPLHYFFFLFFLHFLSNFLPVLFSLPCKPSVDKLSVSLSVGWAVCVSCLSVPRTRLSTAVGSERKRERERERENMPGTGTGDKGEGAFLSSLLLSFILNPSFSLYVHLIVFDFYLTLI